MIKQYRKKSVVIEAIQYTGDYDSFCKIQDFIGQDFIPYTMDSDIKTCGVKTLEGIMVISINDFVIKGINGEFYPCKPYIFEKTYEEVI